MTTLEIRTQLPPAEVFRRARSFFALAGTPYAAFPDGAGEVFLRLRMEVGEIVLGAWREGGETRIRGAASRAVPLLSRFLTTLGPPSDVKQTTRRRGTRREHGANVEEAQPEIAPDARDRAA